MIGFRAKELMKGWHVLEEGDGARLPLEFEVTWGADDLGRWLNPRGGVFLENHLRGTVSAGGLGEDLPCEGTLSLRYFDQHLLRYRMEFPGPRGQLLLVGEKVNIQPWNLPVSHTTCFVRILEGRTLVSTGVVFFPLWSAPAFLASFRPVRTAVS